jgi:hypothetical protein
MNLDEIKAAWKQYDRKLESSKELNEKIVTSMIADRADSRLVRVKRKYIIGIMWMLICLAAGVAVLAGNPFDYKNWFQFIPIVVYVVCLSILTARYVHAYSVLHHIVINHNNVQIALQKIIAIYERPGKFLRYTLVVFLVSQFVLFPLSFLPKNIDNIGLWPALLERLIPISVTCLLFWFAFKLGAFKSREDEKFRNDLNELEQFKLMSRELAS